MVKEGEEGEGGGEFAQAPPSQPTMLARKATREGKHSVPLKHPPTPPHITHGLMHLTHTGVCA